MKKKRGRKTTITVKLVHYNNKSRKGWYVYIKETKKTPSRIKHDGKTPLSTYRKAYIQNREQRKRLDIKAYKRELKRVKKIAREVATMPSISGMLKPQKGQAEEADLLRMNEAAARRLIESAIMPMLNMEEGMKKMTAKALSGRGNARKLSKWMEITVELQDKNGDILATISKTRTLPQKAKSDIRAEGMTRNMIVTDVSPTTFRTMMRGLKDKGYLVEYKKRGRMAKAKTTLTIRR